MFKLQLTDIACPAACVLLIWENKWSLTTDIELPVLYMLIHDSFISVSHFIVISFLILGPLHAYLLLCRKFWFSFEYMRLVIIC